MKIIHRKVLLLVAASVFSCFAVVANAQKRPATYKEFNDASYSRWRSDLKSRAHRIETREETIDNGVVTELRTTISETLPPDRTRYYTAEVSNGKKSEQETIRIDYMLYTRQDSGPWTKVDLRQQNAAGMGSGTGYASTSCVQYTVEDSSLDGVHVKLFESLRIESVSNALRFFEERIWIDEGGLPRREEEIRGKVSPRSETYKQVVEYDYVPNLKIEAPIK